MNSPPTDGTLSERLQWALNESGMTQAELARAVGISPPSLHGLLSGRYKRSRYTAKIAASLGISASWLADGAGRPKAKLSPEAQAMAQIIDALPPEARKEVAGYIGYVVSRMAESSQRDPLTKLLPNIS